jgi:hypothetical protein
VFVFILYGNEASFMWNGEEESRREEEESRVKSGRVLRGGRGNIKKRRRR